MDETKPLKSFPVWLEIGGSLPIINSKSFSLDSLKPARKSLPHLVVTVPLRSEEKRVKISRTPLILKYLKNNWILHSKNETENCITTTTTILSRKRRRSILTERDNESSDSERDTNTPDRLRFKRSEPYEEQINENQEMENEQGTNSIISALNETTAIEGREVIYHFNHDFISRQLDNEDNLTTSTTTNNKPSTSTNINNTCIAAREIEEEEERAKNEANDKMILKEGK